MNQLSPSVAAELFSLIDKNREHLSEWLPWVDRTKQVKDVQSFIAKSIVGAENRQEVHYSITSAREICGIVGLPNIDIKRRKVELGFWLGREYVGQGIMTRSCNSLIDVSRKLGVKQFLIRCGDRNISSIGVAERLNFIPTAYRSDGETIAGRTIPHIIFRKTC